MACVKLLRGQDLRCLSVARKYYQQLVLVNLEDVNEVAYSVSNGDHSIAFNLKPDTKGYKYIGSDTSNLYNASFSKSTQKGMPYYNHSVSLPVVGAGVETKLILKELDLANYFAAIQFRDGTIEIYGFENGLTTDDYTFELQNGLGGTGITLSSRFDEEDIPFVYVGDSEDFDNDFEGIPQLLAGDFNNDFSDDFYIVQL